VAQEHRLAVIPARGGSKRVPRKNIREFLGRPMIAYTIDAALQSGLFARVLVSTDDPEIADVSRAAGAEVPFLRDAALADDYTGASQVTADALERVDPDGTQFSCVAQLMATCPLRTAADIQDSFRQMTDTDTPSQISVTRYGWQNPWWARRRDSSFKLSAFFPDMALQRSQDLPPLYVPVGAIWWAKARRLRETGDFYMSGHTGWEMPWERAVDIDTEDDWRMAECLRQYQIRHSATQ
jgi:pseudaminic acid cytidylyltransferase